MARPLGGDSLWIDSYAPSPPPQATWQGTDQGSVCTVALALRRGPVAPCKKADGGGWRLRTTRHTTRRWPFPWPVHFTLSAPAPPAPIQQQQQPHGTLTPEASQNCSIEAKVRRPGLSNTATTSAGCYSWPLTSRFRRPGLSNTTTHWLLQLPSHFTSPPPPPPTRTLLVLAATAAPSFHDGDIHRRCDRHRR